jgi:hypothetical protein
VACQQAQRRGAAGDRKQAGTSNQRGSLPNAYDRWRCQRSYEGKGKGSAGEQDAAALGNQVRGYEVRGIDCDGCRYPCAAVVTGRAIDHFVTTKVEAEE